MKPNYILRINDVYVRSFVEDLKSYRITFRRDEAAKLTYDQAINLRFKISNNFFNRYIHIVKVD